MQGEHFPKYFLKIPFKDLESLNPKGFLYFFLQMKYVNKLLDIKEYKLLRWGEIIIHILCFMFAFLYT